MIKKIALFIILSAFMAQADFVMEAYPEVVLATGYGETEEDSLKGALTNAIEQVVGTYVAADVIVSNMSRIEENIVSRSAGYIRDYNILSVKRDSGMVRTLIEAEVEVINILEDLTAMNIAILELDPEDVYAQVLTNAARVEETRSYMKAQWPLLFQPGSRFLEFTIDNIYFDEGNMKNGKVPFVVRFYMQPDFAAYDKVVEQLISDFSHFYIATDLGQDGYFMPVKESFSAGKGYAYQAVMKYNGTHPRKGELQMAVRHGQRYVMRNYDITYAFENDIFNILDHNAGIFGDLQDALFKIQFKSNTGALIYENTFSLFPVKDSISMFLEDKKGKESVLWVDNEAMSIKTMGFVPASKYDSRPKITPYIYINAGGDNMAVDKLLLGYQGSIETGQIRKISTITIERLK